MLDVRTHRWRLDDDSNTDQATTTRALDQHYRGLAQANAAFCLQRGRRLHLHSAGTMMSKSG